MAGRENTDVRADIGGSICQSQTQETQIRDRVIAMSFDKHVEAGPFRVSFIRLTHSVPDTSHLVIETPIGIFITGAISNLIRPRWIISRRN